MPSPFPGMDPYIECQANWQDFHNCLIAEIRKVLGVALPGDYIAQTDEHVEIVGPDESPWPHYRPDVMVAREPGPRSPLRLAGWRTMTMEPVTKEPVVIEPVPIERRSLREEEGRSTWVEILLLPDLELVTVIEVLSPSNKERPGRPAYLRKRMTCSIAGSTSSRSTCCWPGSARRWAIPLPAWNYSRSCRAASESRWPTSIGWSIREPLPAIPIPLRAPDPDVLLNLAPLARDVYDTRRVTAGGCATSARSPRGSR